MPQQPQAYLQPYLRAAQRHSHGFGGLLWASPKTQTQRFDALVQAADFHAKSILDVGCGHADLLQYLLNRNLAPAHYVGLEALPGFLQIARARKLPNCQLIEADFVSDPARMLVGADLVVFCGSLNTLDKDTFYRTLSHAFAAAGQSLVFNFLSSDRLAGARWLTWHRIDEVRAFAHGLTADVRVIDDYMEGDCTIGIGKGKST